MTRPPFRTPLVQTALLGTVAAGLPLYHAIVRQKLVRVFEQLGQARLDTLLDGLTPDFEHHFAGHTAIGGVRHTRGAMEQWFGRLYRLFPGIHFTLKHVAVSGPPWNTTAVIEWHDQATLASGERYDNDGVHVVRLRWGRLASLHAYPDTRVVEQAMQLMAERGVAEASAPQIGDE